MKISSFLLLLLAVGLSSPGQTASFDDSKIMHIDYPAWFIDNSFVELSDELEAALDDGKQGLMVLFTTQGCSYCDRFIRTSLADRDIANSVQRNFSSIGLEIFDDREMTHPDGSTTTVKQFAKSEGVEFSPTLLFFGEDGKRLLRLTGYQKPEKFTAVIQYFENKQPNEQLRDFLQRQNKTRVTQSTYLLKHDPLFEKPPFALDRSRFAADKPLLVIFETDDCLACMNFHRDVLSLPEVRKTLAGFDIVRVNKNDNNMPVLTPGGKKTTPENWYETLNFTGLPALVFFDEKGNNVLQTDTLVLKQRMLNATGFVLDKAYEKDWTYQRYARSKSIERLSKKQ